MYRLDKKHIILIALMAGLLATLVGYRYGVGNHKAELPIVLRAIDSSYLRNDFYVNATAQFGPRSYFAQFIALLAKLAPLAYVYLFITFLCNTLTAFVTGLIARDLFDGSNLSAALAISLVMSVDTFWLGYRSLIPDYLLIPSLLAQPLIFLSVWSGFRQHFLLCALFAGIASLVHVTFSLETGVLAIAAPTGAVLLQEGKNALDGKRVVQILAGLFILGSFSLFSFVPYVSAEKIASERFVEILACFRHPHHDCPSTFSKLDYLQALSFALGAGIAWYWWAQNEENWKSKYQKAVFPILAGMIIFTCVGSYYFVEIESSRIWTVARPFRLLFLVKWLGLIWIGGMIGRLLEISQGEDEHDFNAYVLLLGILSPITTGISCFATFLRKKICDFLPRWFSKTSNVFFAPGSIFLFSVTYLAFFQEPSRKVAVLFFTFVFTTLIMARLHQSDNFYSLAITVIIISIWLFILFGGSETLPLGIDAKLQRFKPIINLSSIQGQNADIARWARNNTEDKSIFIAPPSLGQFRLIAERAIVVDFGAFPFQDQAMLEWQRRLFDCYGVPESNGADAIQEMEKNYRSITDSRLRSLQSQYDLTHAVLYVETETLFPILYSNSKYKIVRISEAFDQRFIR